MSLSPVAYYYADEIGSLVDVYTHPDYQPYTSQMAPGYFISKRDAEPPKPIEFLASMDPSPHSEYDELVKTLQEAVTPTSSTSQPAHGVSGGHLPPVQISDPQTVYEHTEGIISNTQVPLLASRELMTEPSLKTVTKYCNAVLKSLNKKKDVPNVIRDAVESVLLICHQLKTTSSAFDSRLPSLLSKSLSICFALTRAGFGKPAPDYDGSPLEDICGLGLWVAVLASFYKADKLTIVKLFERDCTLIRNSAHYTTKRIHCF